MFIVLTAFGVASSTTTTTTPPPQSTPTTPPPQTRAADFTVFPPSISAVSTRSTTSTTTPAVTSLPTMQLQSTLTTQTRSADMTVFPPATGTGLPTTGYPSGLPTTGFPTGYPLGYPITGLPTTGFPTTGLPTGLYPTGTDLQQIQINPITGQYLVPTPQVTPGGTPPGCGTFRNCLACRQASWYGCAWNPGNLNAPVGCSQTWGPSQCTGIAGPTETLAPCAAYQDCASCTNQAGCVFLLQTGSCVYSAGPSCLQDPARCANYPAQCPARAALPYTVSAYDPTAIYKNPLTYTSSVYVPGVTGSSIPNYLPLSTGVGTTFPITGTNPLAVRPFPTLPTTLSTAYPTVPSAYTPTYTGYGSLLPMGTLGTLSAYSSPFLLGQTPAPQQYLTTQLVPYTTTQLVPVTTITSTPGPNSVPIGNGGFATLPYGVRSADVSGQATGQTAATQGLPTTGATGYYPATGAAGYYPPTTTGATPGALPYTATSSGGVLPGYQYYPQP